MREQGGGDVRFPSHLLYYLSVVYVRYGIEVYREISKNRGKFDSGPQKHAFSWYRYLGTYLGSLLTLPWR